MRSPFAAFSITGLLLTCAACGVDSTDSDPSGKQDTSRGETFDIAFNNGLEGWKAGFSDYPVGMEEFFELDSGHRPLPAPLDSKQSAFFITGDNMRKGAALNTVQIAELIAAEIAKGAPS